jgi:hypothetical protein
MYWSQELTAKMIYDVVDDIEYATHVLIRGRPGNVEVCKLDDLTEKVRPILQKFNVRESKLYLTTHPFFVSQAIY